MDDRGEPDIIVMTEAAKAKILTDCEGAQGFTCDTYDGIPFESFDTIGEAIERARAIHNEHGWQVLVLHDESQPQGV